MPHLPYDPGAVVGAAVTDVRSWDGEARIHMGKFPGFSVLEEYDLVQRLVFPAVAPQQDGLWLLEHQARGLEQQPV